MHGTYIKTVFSMLYCEGNNDYEYLVGSNVGESGPSVF
jgi:hypothetical protein